MNAATASTTIATPSSTRTAPSTPRSVRRRHRRIRYPTVTFVSCNALGYADNNDDCNDALEISPTAPKPAPPTRTRTVTETTTTPTRCCLNWHRDGDGDGYGDPLDSLCLRSADGEYASLAPDDCDDADANIAQTPSSHAQPTASTTTATASATRNSPPAAPTSSTTTTSTTWDHRQHVHPHAGRLYTATATDDCDDFNAALTP